MGRFFSSDVPRWTTSDRPRGAPPCRLARRGVRREATRLREGHRQRGGGDRPGRPLPSGVIFVTCSYPSVQRSRPRRTPPAPIRVNARGLGSGGEPRNSQARASAHSRFTVAGELSRTVAVSSIESPPKKRRSTSLRLARRASPAPRRRRRARAGRRDRARLHLGDVDRDALPLAAALVGGAARARDRRGCAASSTRRARRSARGSASRRRPGSTSRRYASWTSAVGCSVWSRRSRPR